MNSVALEHKNQNSDQIIELPMSNKPYRFSPLVNDWYRNTGLSARSREARLNPKEWLMRTSCRPVTCQEGFIRCLILRLQTHNGKSTGSLMLLLFVWNELYSLDGTKGRKISIHGTSVPMSLTVFANVSKTVLTGSLSFFTVSVVIWHSELYHLPHYFFSMSRLFLIL